MSSAANIISSRKAARWRATSTTRWPSVFFAASLVIIWLASAISGGSLLNSFSSVTDPNFNPGSGRPTKTPVTAKERMTTQISAPFYEVLRKTLKKRGTSIDKICPGSDAVARRVLEDYGAMFVASKKVVPPPACVFISEDQVTKFQLQAGVATETIGADEIELQPEAMKQFLKARAEANKERLDITPRGGTESARRNFVDSMRLWDTRLLPA